jgi:hypothetical protein
MNREGCFSLSMFQKPLIHTLKERKMHLSVDKTDTSSLDISLFALKRTGFLQYLALIYFYS